MRLQLQWRAGMLLLPIVFIGTSEAAQVLRATAESADRWHMCPIPGSKDWWTCWHGVTLTRWFGYMHVCRESCCCNGGLAWIDGVCQKSPIAELPCSLQRQEGWTDLEMRRWGGKHREPEEDQGGVSVNDYEYTPQKPRKPAPKVKEEKEEEEEMEEPRTTTPKKAPSFWSPPPTTHEMVIVDSEPDTTKPPVKLDPEEIAESMP
eukprot:TRINITY_DN626_c0_g2_i1.p2 TRINITY_DN626_c0_g2~~TRINITY_DN626_c0_g2_i1.p2  ORF type:complete len:205 (-),score=52.16 TRINITY_DN626_c0_g2_i1:101-715(-)